MSLSLLMAHVQIDTCVHVFRYSLLTNLYENAQVARQC